MCDAVLQGRFGFAESYPDDRFAVEVAVRIFDLPDIIPQTVLMWIIRIEPNAVSVDERTPVNGFDIYVLQIFGIH